MNELSIGIFDSGLGGLTTVKKLQQYLPHENIIYFGDTYNLPYGDKSTETILSYARKNISFLEKQNVKLIYVNKIEIKKVAVVPPQKNKKTLCNCYRVSLF